MYHFVKMTKGRPRIMRSLGDSGEHAQRGRSGRGATKTAVTLDKGAITSPPININFRSFVLCCFALFFLAAVLPAQSSGGDVFDYPLGPETRDAFNATCALLAGHPLAAGTFTQEKNLSRLNRTLRSSGGFIMAAALGMAWETEKPFPSTLVLGKDYLIQSRPGGQKTVLSAEGNETFVRLASVISAVFSGDARALEEHFKVYYTASDSETAAAVAAWELGLSPLDGAVGSFAEKITMKGDEAIRSITIYERNGDSIRYMLSGHRYPAELNAREKELFVR